MPLFDTYSTAVVSSYDDTQFVNILYWQQVAEDVAGADMQALFTAVQGTVIPEWQKFCSDRLTFQYCVVRRLAPAITDVLELALSGAGDIPQAPLSGTCYSAACYYSDPYEKGTHYHWKLNGIPHDGARQGRLTEQQLVRYGAFINLLTAGPIDVTGEEFQLINSKDALDGIVGIKPVVNKISIHPKIRNLASRQMRSVV